MCTQNASNTFGYGRLTVRFVSDLCPNLVYVFTNSIKMSLRFPWRSFPHNLWYLKKKKKPPVSIYYCTWRYFEEVRRFSLSQSNDVIVDFWLLRLRTKRIGFEKPPLPPDNESRRRYLCDSTVCERQPMLNTIKALKTFYEFGFVFRQWRLRGMNYRWRNQNIVKTTIKCICLGGHIIFSCQNKPVFVGK